MAETILGVDFEVHGGGSDLVFPHHENEIAQTEAARAAPLARVWMHNGMVELDTEKMAKSVGNIRSLHGALDEFGRDALVMWLVSAHYRKPVAFSEEALADAGRAVARLRELCRRLDRDGSAPAASDEAAERFFDALADDFNTAAARAVLFDCAGEANRRLDAGERLHPGRLGEMLYALGLEGLQEQAVREAEPPSGSAAGAAARTGPRGPRLCGRRSPARRARRRGLRCETRPAARSRTWA